MVHRRDVCSARAVTAVLRSERVMNPTANVPTVIWACRSPTGRRWCHATLWRQPSTPTRLVVWSDRGRERLTWHEVHAEAMREAERLRTRLEAKGWTFEAALDTGRGWVVVDTYRAVFGPFTYHGTLQADEVEREDASPVFIGAVVDAVLERTDERLQVSKQVSCPVAGVEAGSLRDCINLTRREADACCRKNAEKEGIG